MQSFQVNKCKRCCLICCGRRDSIKHKYLGGEWPTIEDAVDPSLIEWKNLGKGRIERCTRTSCVWIISILLILLAFLPVLWVVPY